MLHWLKRHALHPPIPEFADEQVILFPAVDRIHGAELPNQFSGRAETPHDRTVEPHLIDLTADIEIVGRVGVRHIHDLVRPGGDADRHGGAEAPHLSLEVPSRVEDLDPPVRVVGHVESLKHSSRAGIWVVRKSWLLSATAWWVSSCARNSESKAGPEELEITVYGEEPRPAYDRVHLSSYFSGKDADDLLMAPRSWYEEQHIAPHTSERVEWIDRSAKRIGTKSGASCEYDELVLATGSSPFVPDVVGSDLPGVFLYRTIEDLEAIEDYGFDCDRGAVLGSGLLGMEAAKALLDMELDTTVVEFMPRLMPRQLDDGAAVVLRDQLEGLGLGVLMGKETEEIYGADGVTSLGFSCGPDRAAGLRFSDASTLPTDILVISAGDLATSWLGRAA